MKNLLLILSLFFSCSLNSQNVTNGAIKLIPKENFQTIINGKKVSLFTLKNASGLVSQITNYGGKVVSLWIPDRLGNFDDVVLGHANIQDYLNSKEKHFGAVIGRYANRIGEGKFSLDGKEYTLTTNEGKNHRHGGKKSFNSVVWDAVQIDNQTLELSYVSEDMEEGYPGKLTVKVQYQLTEENELKIEYWATTDAKTVINLTNHSFFNLRGHANGTINNHILQINASYYTPINKGFIPTGTIETVENTPFDFQKPVAIGKRVNKKNNQLKNGFGYDHNFVLNQSLEGLNFAAKVVEPISGRIMEIYTNEPGLQFYGGNFLDGSILGKENKYYKFRTAFCLETQHFPDSPNNVHFPTTTLNPSDKYYSICVYKFSLAK